MVNVSLPHASKPFHSATKSWVWVPSMSFSLPQSWRSYRGFMPSFSMNFREIGHKAPNHFMKMMQSHAFPTISFCQKLMYSINHKKSGFPHKLERVTIENPTVPLQIFYPPKTRRIWRQPKVKKKTCLGPTMLEAYLRLVLVYEILIRRRRHHHHHHHHHQSIFALLQIY